jgi:hypothetical protein
MKQTSWLKQSIFLDVYGHSWPVYALPHCVLFCRNAKCRYAECRSTNLTSANEEVERHCDQLVLTRSYMYWPVLNKLLRSSKQQFYGKFELELQSVNDQGILKGEVSLCRWPPVWLIWNQQYDLWQFMLVLWKQTNPNQSNSRSTDSDISPFSIPWTDLWLPHQG